jgi:hypothetical protein
LKEFVVLGRVGFQPISRANQNTYLGDTFLPKQYLNLAQVPKGKTRQQSYLPTQTDSANKDLFAVAKSSKSHLALRPSPTSSIFSSYNLI